MSITVLVPGVLRSCCDGSAEITLSATSIRSALGQIEQRHPALYRSICDETGAVRRHVNLFVNRAHIRDRQGMETELAGGDVIWVLQAVSGG